MLVSSVVVVKLRMIAASAATATPTIAIQAIGLKACAFCSQHCLYFLPLPHGQGSFRPTLPALATVTTSSPAFKAQRDEPVYCREGEDRTASSRLHERVSRNSA